MSACEHHSVMTDSQAVGLAKDLRGLDPERGSGDLGGLGNAEYVEVDWDTALDVVTRKWAQVKAESGGDAFAVLTSAKCTNEENFLVNKLVRQVLGTNSLDHCARL